MRTTAPTDEGAHQYDDSWSNDAQGQSSHMPEDRQRNRQKNSHGLPLSHVTTGVGEPHTSSVAGSPKGASDTPMSHSKVTLKLPISEPAKSLAWSSEPDPTEGYVTKVELSQKQVNSGGNVSSNPAKSSTLEASEVRRMTVTRDKLAIIENMENDVLQAMAKAEKGQGLQLDINIGPTPMIFEDGVGWIDDPVGPKGRFWKCIIRSGEIQSPAPTTNKGAQKRNGPTPLQELDPNSIPLK
ncbi:hypothetical protein CFP56_020972 [Quercus suber]|uniref:Uncharacterized protein n=1 Tax=Quercus suber TaxID=58331 RepID=A0AAW0M2D8_QUESU